MTRQSLSVALVFALVAIGCGESNRGVGSATGDARTPQSVSDETAQQVAAARALRSPDARVAKSILFGDLHVHTTFSIDAFLQALPIFGGEGAHPPADACDFARHCAGLDFFSLNDHAESLPPTRWRESIDSVRECNARAGDASNPDLVAYAGYEWTQAGPTPESHWGHKNVVFRGLADSEIGARPIDSLPANVSERARGLGIVSILAEFEPLGIYSDFFYLLEQLATAKPCEAGVDTRELPTNCRESAETPAELFEKLAQAGQESLVIPHGLAWGQHGPPVARLDTQLAPGQHDPNRQRLIEVYSGHGNSEEFRAAHRYETTAAGAPMCSPPSDDFLPCCWRAGELMRKRCGDLPENECEARVAEAQQLALDAKTAPHLVFPETQAEDWLDCDQCRDCFKPVFNPRPGMTAQYAAALSQPEDGSRFRWGFIASSDNHTGRPGTGYKQFARHGMTDVRGFKNETLDGFTRPILLGRSEDPQRGQAVPWEERGFRGLFNKERVASFMYPGGLVAVHSEARDRDSIWQALDRKEVYGTSGPRILLWFDLLKESGERVPMGGEVEFAVGASAPHFEVRASGSRVQQAGCSEENVAALGADRIAALCLGECHHPSDERHVIEAIEVVRIRPQQSPEEDIADLIEDPWRRFACDADAAGCVVRFEDPDFTRDTVYYVRALQEPTDAVNGANLRATFAENSAGSGREATSVEPCHAGWRTPWDDACLSPVRERAWSSPIYVDVAAAD
ncbi:MAG: DUF3604 domain-containing protein [Myxococcota bacterium]|nr:DUF3604 domain-containing protein [Myxococcota bacterium]